MKKIFSFIIILTLLLTISISAFAVSVNMTVNQDIGSRGLYTISAGETMSSITWTGVIPDGLYIERDDNSISLKGTPKNVGNFAFTLFIKVMDASGNEVDRMVDVSGNITDGSVVFPTPETPGSTSPVTTPAVTSTPAAEYAITKHPGAENRTAGGYAIFIAKASGATNSTWTLVAPDGGQYSVDSFKAKYPNMQVSVENKSEDGGVLSSTITIRNITTDVSGYSAYVTFINAANTPLKSNSAIMTVNAATPSPAPTRAPAPSAAPTAVPTTAPVPTLAPTTTSALPATPAPTASADEPVPTDSPQAGAHSTSNSDVIGHRSNTGAIIATVFVGILTVAIAMVLILYVQGKLDLSWLENKLEKRGHDDDDDDFEE